MPIDDPLAIADRLSPLFDSPIDIGYYSDWLLDSERSIISSSGNYKWISLERVKRELEDKDAKLDIKNKSAQTIYNKLGGNISARNFDNVSTYERFMDKILNPYDVYELEASDFRPSMRIFKEIFEFDINIPYRWFQFKNLFSDISPQSNLELKKLRDYIHWQCKLTGCDRIFYFPDQYYGESLYNEINRPSAEWLEFMTRLSEKEGYSEDDIFDINDYLEHNKTIPLNKDVYCFVDEFKDISSKE